MKTFFSCSLMAILLATTLFTAHADPEAAAFQAELKRSKGKPNNNNKGGGGGGGGNHGGIGDFMGPGGGFGVPGFGNGWDNGIFGGGGGYGGGYGTPTGGYSKGGIIRPTVVCKEKGRCYGKKLTCPARCFSSYSRSGKNYGAGGGGGGCTVDCKKNCVAYC